MKTRRPSIVSTSIDFFSCTTENPVTLSQMETLSSIEVDRATASAERVKERRVHDYVGHGTKRMAYCLNSTGKALFTLVGSAAQDHWPVTRTWIIEKVTRLDLAVTVELERPRDLASLGYRDESYDLEPGKLRNTKRTLWQSDDGGKTLYLGKRGQERYARLYDKGVQLGVGKPGEMWRYEVELRRGVATTVWESLVNDSSPHDLLAAFVWEHFRKRGVAPCFERGSKAVVLRREVHVSTVDTKLKWLRTSVAPVVSQLLLAGLTTEVYDSLSLPKKWRESI